MFLIAGESNRRSTQALGTGDCVACGAVTEFVRVKETHWLTLFWLPLIPLQTVAHYDECCGCGCAFVCGRRDAPSELLLVQTTLVYMLLGYGMHDHEELAALACLRLTGFEFRASDYKTLLSQLQATSTDLQKIAEEAAPTLNAQGRQRVIGAAYLMAYASCEMEYADRLRINLLGTALGQSLGETDAIVTSLRDQQYLGIRRYLPTMKA